MTEKILIKIDWNDICKHFPKAVKNGILNNLYRPHLIIPTTYNSTKLSELKTCVDEWHLADVKLTHNGEGFITFELTWNDNYQIEVDV